MNFNSQLCFAKQMNFKEWLVLVIEGQAQDQALKLLGGDQVVFQQINQISPEPKYLPVLAFFHQSASNLRQLKKDIEDYKSLVDKKKLPMLQITKKGAMMGNQPIDYLGWTEKVHALIGQQQFQQKQAAPTPAVKSKPIFKKNGIEVFEAHGKDKCIQYGRGYSFCISQMGNTMWQSYRDTQQSTFYFVFDRNLPTTNPLHIVVVDHTTRGFRLTDANNTTGHISKFGTNVEAYFEYLESKGVPKSIFQHVPHSEEEKQDMQNLRYNKDLTWFINLSHGEKSRYIGRGNELTDEQFEYLWEHKLSDLINQYVTTGMRLEENQRQVIYAHTQTKKSYIRSRIIAHEQAESDDEYEEYGLVEDEFQQLNSKEKQKIISETKSFGVALQIGFAKEWYESNKDKESQIADFLGLGGRWSEFGDEVWILDRYQEASEMNEFIYSQDDALKYYLDPENWEAFEYDYQSSWSDLKSDIDKEMEEMMIQYANDHIEDAEDWDEEENGKFTDAEDAYDNFEEIRDALSSAAQDGSRIGAENEAWETFRNTVKNGNGGFRVNLEDHPYELQIDKDDLFDLLKDEDWRVPMAEEQSDIFDLMKEHRVFEYSVPYYGFSGFSEETFQERAKELLHELK